MPDSTFLKRVVLKNYKSIAACDVRLHPLVFFVGANGAGKSNFLDSRNYSKRANALIKLQSLVSEEHD
jgi:predicted ATPase